MNFISISVGLSATYLAIQGRITCAFAVTPQAAGSVTASSLPELNPGANNRNDGSIDSDLAERRIKSGRVFFHHNFLTEDQISYLQKDMELMKEEGRFVVNGLSDVRKGLKGEVVESTGSINGEEGKKSNQGFDVKVDRSVCPVPWWKDSLEMSLDGECPDGNVGRGDLDSDPLLSIQLKLQQLRGELSRSLGRPTMLDSHLGHVSYISLFSFPNIEILHLKFVHFSSYFMLFNAKECYYSESAPGSSLARHMDERHEETKGKLNKRK